MNGIKKYVLNESYKLKNNLKITLVDYIFQNDDVISWPEYTQRAVPIC